MAFKFGGELTKTDVQNAMTSLGYTAARAVKLDKLNTTISSRQTSGLAGGAVKLSASGITNVQQAMSGLGYTGTRAVKLDKLNTTVGSRMSSGLFPAVKLSATGITNVKSAMTSQGYTTAKANFLNTTISSRATSGLTVTATLSAAGALQVWNRTVASAATAGTFGAKLQASVQSGMTSQGYTAAKAAFINTTISSRMSSGGSVALTTAARLAIWQTLTASVATAGSFGLLIKTDLNTTISSRFGGASGITHIQTALTNQGYTATRAGNLDHCNTNTSSRMSSGASVGLSAAGARAVWGVAVASANTAGTFGAKLQQSVQSGMTSQGYIGAKAAFLNTTIGSRAAPGDAMGLSVGGKASVQTAMTNQGYTVARAGNLDHCNTNISTRMTSGASVGLTAAGALQVWNRTVASAATAGTFGAKLQVSTQTGMTNQGYTVAKANFINTALGTIDTNIKTHVQTGLTNQGYTVAKAAFLNTTIGSRAIETSVITHVKSALTSYGYTSALSTKLGIIGTQVATALSRTNTTLIMVQDTAYRSVIELKYSITGAGSTITFNVYSADTNSAGTTWLLADTFTQSSTLTNAVTGYLNARRYVRFTATKRSAATVAAQIVSLI